MLLSSRAALTRGGLFDDYEANLSPGTRAQLRDMVAGVWLPVETAVEHYAACDLLQLSRAAQQALGKSNSERLSGTLLGTLAQLARAAGTTPMTMVDQMPRFWGRVFDGGSIVAERRGPKDVIVRVTADPVLRSEYFRHGLMGFAEMMLGLVATRVYVRVKVFDASEAWVVYIGQWA
jgi:hypothetical protein